MIPLIWLFGNMSDQTDAGSKHAFMVLMSGCFLFFNKRIVVFYMKVLTARLDTRNDCTQNHTGALAVGFLMPHLIVYILYKWKCTVC